MITEEQIRTMRNNADNRLQALNAQAVEARTEMATLQERYNVKQQQLSAIAQQMIETNGTLTSLNAILGPDNAVGVGLPPPQFPRTQVDLNADGA